MTGLYITTVSRVSTASTVGTVGTVGPGQHGCARPRRFTWLARALCWLLFGALGCALPAGATDRAADSAPDRASKAGFGIIEPYFENVGDAELLPKGIITALLQDARGWLWIGTQLGLIRYDGYHFRKFVHDDADPASIPGNYITALWQGGDGQLWIGTNSDGLARFDPDSERFTHWRHDPARGESLSAGTVWALRGDAAGGVWVGTQSGLDYLPPAAGQLRHYRHDAHDSHDTNKPHKPHNPDGLLDNRVYSLLLDKQGALWIGTAGGLQRRKPGSSGFESIASDPANPASLAGQEIWSLFQGSDGKLWLGTRTAGAAWLDDAQAANPGQLHWLSAAPQAAERLTHGWVRSIAEPQPGQIWFATFGGGVSVVAGHSGEVLRHFRHDPVNPNSLGFDALGAMLPDRAGLLWLGTWGGGLQRYQAGQHAFGLLRHSPNRPASLSHPDVMSLLEWDDGKLLVGSSGNGIDVIDRQRGLVGGYRAHPGQAGALQDAAIPSMARTPDGALWAGTRQAGVFRLAAGSQTWQAFGTAQGLPHVRIRKLFVTHDGVLWVGTANGLARWLPETGRFDAARQIDGSLLQANVFAMAEDASGRLWLGSDAGLWLKQPGAAGLLPIRKDDKRPDSLASDEIFGILVDRAGQLWVSTGKGLDCLQSLDGKPGQKGAVFDHAIVHTNRSGQYIGSNLLQDRQGRIWTGEFVFDPATRHLLRLVKADGFDIGTNWTGSYTRTADGLLLYGGTKGLAVIDSEQFAPWVFQPPLQASELKIDGKTVSIGSLKDGLTLRPEQRRFSIEFSALDFSSPQHNRYAYRLQGIDRDWIETDAEHRLASYGNLWPGHYTLHVRGSNRLGEWSSHQLRIPIQVLPAFWQTGWFMAVCALCLALCVWGGHRWRSLRLRKEAQALQAQVTERTAEVVAAHDAAVASHRQLEVAHQELVQAHQQLVSTQNELVSTQDQLALVQQLEQAREQMLQQEKMAALGTLTAGVAHEINNPTNFTHVAAQIQRTSLSEFEQFVLNLFDDSAEPRMVQAFTQRFAALQSNVDTMLQGTERIQTIVSDLRAFSRREHLEQKAVHLSQCLLSTLNLVRINWASQVEFITELTDDPLYECWPTLLNQVLMNLMVNACHAIASKRSASASEQPGHLWLRLLQKGEWLVLEIEDDGCGMEPAVRERILEPFFTTKDVQTGTGLGLSITQGIIEKHGGRLEISSVAGQGSCFAVYLPLNRDAVPGADAAQPHAGLPATPATDPADN